MKLSCICFSQAGQLLAETVLPRLRADWSYDITCGYGPEKRDLSQWTGEMFAAADALLFIGAAGIAVRAIAPHVKSKLHDPAVVVMDEAGRYAVSLLSGHIGGANHLTRCLAELSGGEAVVTTGTDVHGVLALDAWASEQNMEILNPEKIKGLSARLLRGDTITVFSDVPIQGPVPGEIVLTQVPDNADVLISHYFYSDFNGLHLVPRCVALGVGCRQGGSATAIRKLLLETCTAARILPTAICGVYSIDRKAEEPGILAVCKQMGVKLVIYSSNQLNLVKGCVSQSDFVKTITGVDNVCERAALAEGGKLLVPKIARDGVTVALALREVSYSFGGKQ